MTPTATRILCIFPVLMVLVYPVHSQTVTVSSITLDVSRSLDGIAVDSQGKIFAAGGYDSSTIYSVDSDGTTTAVASGFQSGPVDIDFDSDGTMYATGFPQNRLWKIDLSNGSMTPWASTLFGPSGLTIDRTNNRAFVSHYGTGALGDGNVVLSIDLTTQERTTFAAGGGMRAPAGIVMDNSGNLYTTNLVDGKLHRIDPSGAVTLLATLPIQSPVQYNIGHIAFANGYLYTPGMSKHVLYRVSLTGEFEVIAGTGTAGHTDGPGLSAQFNQPNGITASMTGDSLFVTELNNPGVVRVVELNTSTGAASPAGELPVELTLNGVYPNPMQVGVKSTLRIPAEIPTAGAVNLEVLDMQGRQISRSTYHADRPGRHVIPMDLHQLASGMYFCSVQLNGIRKTVPFVVLNL